MGCLKKKLANSRFLAGDDYTIADIATFPWALNPGRKEQKPKDLPNVMRWIDD